MESPLLTKSKVNKTNISQKINIKFIIIFVAIILVAAILFVINLNQQTTSSNDPNVLNQITLSKLKKMILLPSDTPTITTIKDVASLQKDADFYIDAKNGDKLVLFKKKAIIFREGEDLIVNEAPITVEGN